MGEAENSSPGTADQVPPAGLGEDAAGAVPASSDPPGAGAPVEAVATDSDGQGYPSMTSFWRRWGRSLNENSLARGLLFLVLIFLTVAGAAYWLDSRSAERQEVVENTRFVRQVAFDSTAELKPFTEFNLHGAQLWGLPLECSDLNPRTGCAELMGADLSDTDLSEANLTGAFLYLANLSGAFLGGTNLTAADVRAVDATSAILNNVNLTGADLRDATLVGVSMIQADLTHADLRGTDFTGADLTNATTSAACYDSATQWPENYQPADPSDCSTASRFP